MSPAPPPPPDYRCDLDRIIQNVPICLREAPQWVCWRWKWNGKKWTKVPVNPLTGGDGDSTDPGSWGGFAAAAAGLRRWRDIAGLGFVFSGDDPYCGVDLDNCLNPATGTVRPWAITIIRKLNCYCEISPSGTGVKLFLRATKPGPRCSTGHEDGKVEIYDRDRFFTTTGYRILRSLDGGRIETG